MNKIIQWLRAQAGYLAGQAGMDLSTVTAVQDAAERYYRTTPCSGEAAIQKALSEHSSFRRRRRIYGEPPQQIDIEDVCGKARQRARRDHLRWRVRSQHATGARS